MINLMGGNLCLHELVVCLEKKIFAKALSCFKVAVEKNN